MKIKMTCVPLQWLCRWSLCVHPRAVDSRIDNEEGIELRFHTCNSVLLSVSLVSMVVQIQFSGCGILFDVLWKLVVQIPYTRLFHSHPKTGICILSSSFCCSHRGKFVEVAYHSCLVFKICLQFFVVCEISHPPEAASIASRVQLLETVDVQDCHLSICWVFQKFSWCPWCTLDSAWSILAR